MAAPVLRNEADFPSLTPSKDSNDVPLPKPTISFSELLKKPDTTTSFSSLLEPPKVSSLPGPGKAGLNGNKGTEGVGVLQPPLRGDLRDSRGVRTLVVDANALIKGMRLERFNAEQVFTVAEVLNEIKDENSRRILATLPFDILCQEPTEESIKTVMRFAKETGDLHSLSGPDVKLIALAYTLEEARHGASHLRKYPPPLIQIASSKRVPLSNLPGWGKVDNPEEWAEIDKFRDDGTKIGDQASTGRKSRILGLTTIELNPDLDSSENLHVVESQAKFSNEEKKLDKGVENGRMDDENEVLTVEQASVDSVNAEFSRAGEEFGENVSERVINPEHEHRALSSAAESVQGYAEKGSGASEIEESIRKGRSHKNFARHEIQGEESFEGKVAVIGVDASRGEPEGGEWEKAGGKSLRRKTLKKEKKKALLMKTYGAEKRGGVKVNGKEEKERERLEDDEEKSVEEPGSKMAEGSITDSLATLNLGNTSEHKAASDTELNESSENPLHSIDERRAYESDDGVTDERGNASPVLTGESNEGEQEGEAEKQQRFVEENDTNDGEVAFSECSHVDEESESSFHINELSESSIACITSDFAMQNVIMQMGLRLLTVDGMRINKLQKFVLKCHACQTITKEIGRIFCPSCGNGGTLNKVSVIISENTVVVANPRRRRINLRGTKFNLPAPVGGREGAEKNLILREDQLPKRFRKKPSNANSDPDYDSWFQGAGIKPKSSSDRIKGTIPFLSRRNPNENRIGKRK